MNQRRVYRSFGLLTLGVIAALACAAQSPQENKEQKPVIDWQQGPGVGKLGSIAEIKIPDDMLFTDRTGTQKLLELTQNIPNGRELGALRPREGDWFVIFEFREIGYVKDDEKDKLDAPALLKSLQEGTESANEIRKQKGWPAFHVVGWQKQPFYDPKTNNLTWSILGRSDGGGDSVNHSTKLLGRRGTMDVDLVVDPKDYAQVEPVFAQVMTGFGFVQGSRYADFVSGDKVATYGLSALIMGGAGAAALKSGLLQKFWKLIVVGVVALGAAAKKLFGVIFGKKEERDPALGPPLS
jgi:uncharacterized membrane-anchored protein